MEMIIVVSFLAIVTGIFAVLWIAEKRKTADILKTITVITDAEAYTKEMHLKSDTYLNQTKAEADRYSAEKHNEADRYFIERRQELDKAIAESENKIPKLQEELHLLTQQKVELEQELESLSKDVLVGSVRIDGYDNLKSDEVKNQLSVLKVRQDNLVRGGKAVEIVNSFMRKNLERSQSKQILRCFNSECSRILDAVSAKNVDSSRSKIQRSFDSLNRMFAIDGVQISSDYLLLKFEELSLVYAYMIKVEEEQEQRQAIREQMVEEEKVRREIEREKQKIEKEERQFTNEVNKLMAYMQQAKDDIERQLYIDKIKDLEERLKALQIDKEKVLNREKNTRAGFVYIISNIGSFGDRVFKIGMTRRLEPMDRIAELSSASVPFPFDVHAMIFSDDAPALEAVLHNHFDSNRLNKLNPRKEFFRVDLEEIKKVVLEHHNATVRFIDIPGATEYRETLRIEEGTLVSV